MRRRQLLCALPIPSALGMQRAAARDSKPLTLVVPFASGASVDLLTRMLAREITVSAGRHVLVDNRPGANGIIGAEFVKNAAPDGRTLYIANVGSHAINVSLYGKRLPYDALTDFTPISLLWRFPSVLAVPASGLSRHVSELVARARQSAQGVTYASAGSGSGGHLLGEMLRAQSSGRFHHVPYKGAAPAVVDLIGARVDCFFVSYSSIQKQVEQGMLRVLAVAGDQRLGVLPDIPTMREVGYDAVHLQNWFGLVSPAKTSPEDVLQVHRLFADVLSNATVVRTMMEQGVEAAASAPAEFAQLMRSDIERLGRIVRATGAVVD